MGRRGEIEKPKTRKRVKHCTTYKIHTEFESQLVSTVEPMAKNGASVISIHNEEAINR